MSKKTKNNISIESIMLQQNTHHFDPHETSYLFQLPENNNYTNTHNISFTLKNNSYIIKKPALIQSLIYFNITLSQSNIYKLITQVIFPSCTSDIFPNKRVKPFHQYDNGTQPEWYEILLNGSCGFNFARWHPNVTLPTGEIIAQKTAIINTLYDICEKSGNFTRRILPLIKSNKLPEMTENNFLILSRIIFGNPSTYNPPLMVDLYPNIHINYVTQHLFSPVYTVIKLFTQYNNLNCAHSIHNYLIQEINNITTEYIPYSHYKQLSYDLNKIIYNCFCIYMNNFIDFYIDTDQLQQFNLHQNMQFILLKTNFIWFHSSFLLKKPFIKPDNIYKQIMPKLKQFTQVFSNKLTGSVTVYNKLPLNFIKLKYSSKIPNFLKKNNDSSIDESFDQDSDSDSDSVSDSDSDLVVTVDKQDIINISPQPDFTPKYILNGQSYDSLQELHNAISNIFVNKTTSTDSNIQNGTWTIRSNQQPTQASDDFDGSSGSQFSQSPQPLHDSQGSDDSQIYEIEKIIKHKIVSGTTKFYVKWVGYSNKDNTWEPAINFIGSVAKSMLNSYLKSNGLDHDGSGSATEPDDSATEPDDSAT